MITDVKIKSLVEEYIATKMNDDIKYIKKITTLSKTLSFEEYLKNCFTFFPEHKWHLSLNENNINAYKEVFLYLKTNYSKISKIAKFDDLICYIDNLNVKHFGELSVYDLSLAVGVFFNLTPDKVFLHAGPKNSMKYILGKDYNDLIKHFNNKRIEYISVEDTPSVFNDLKKTPFLIEDCLCFIWSQYLKPKKFK